MTYYLTFKLGGDLALWRNPYEPVGSYSALGPAPSHIAGLLGAVMGYASPLSYAAQSEPHEKGQGKSKKKKASGPAWPVAPKLLQWQREQDVHLACAWMGGAPRRIPWNVKGYKDANMETLRLQQQVVVRPGYIIAVALSEHKANKYLAQCLKHPKFPVYLGSSAFRGYITDIELHEMLPPKLAPHGWAYRTDNIGLGEQMPFTRHNLEPEMHHGRLAVDGFWVYPTPLHTPPQQDELPWVRSYASPPE